MNYQRRRIILWLSLIWALGVILTGATACEPNFILVTENQTDQVLTICYGGPSLGDLEPGESITEEVSSEITKFTLLALNTWGELVFAQRFTLETLEEVQNGFLWKPPVRKAVIPPDTPLRGSTFLDLIIENKTDMVLTVSVNNEELGDINPGETATKGNIPFEQYRSGYRIIAKNAQGQTIFDDKLYVTSLQIIDLRTWKAVIE